MAKLLMLAHAFEVPLVARAHQIAPDLVVRDSAGYSIVASEWPGVKTRETGRRR